MEDVPKLCRDVELLNNWLDWLHHRCLNQNPVAGRLYLLRTHHRKFVSLNDTNRLVGRQDDPGEATRFVFEERDDKKFVLRLANQRYVKVVLPGFELTADAEHQDTATRFALLHLGGGKLAFYYYHGDIYRFVSARHEAEQWELRAKERHCEFWEWFEVVPCDPQLPAVSRTLGERLDGLEETLRNGVPGELRLLCDQQLAAIDERMAEMNALEARVRELVKNLKS